MTDRLALPRRYREQLEALLREHVPGVEVWAYGSRVNGDSHDGSDLDLALRGPALEPLDGGFYGLLEAIEKSNVPILVQAHDWAMLPESFHREIERDYVVVQKGAYHTLSNGWRRVALGDVIELQLSSVDKKSKASEQAVQLCNYMDVYSNSFIHHDMEFMAATASDQEISNCSLFAGDVVITKDSETHDDIGVPALVREDIPNLICGYHLAILRPRLSEINGTYLFYALSTDATQQQFHSYANGVTRFGLRKADIGLVEIPLPPLAEQRAIAHVLGTLDDKIELNRRMNETLESMARALFKSWFVDFEPVRAKMEGRWRRGQSLPGLSADLYDLFPDRLVDSERGEVPEGWEVKPLGEVVQIHDSKRIPLNSRQRAIRQGPYPYYGAAGVVGYVDDYLFDGIFVLVGEDGTVMADDGMVSPQYVWGEFWVNNHAHVLKGKNGITDELLYLMLQEVNIVPYVTGAVQPKVSQTNLKRVPVVTPPKAVCEVFSDMVQPYFAQIRVNADESRTLTAQRDALLPRLVLGEVRT